MYYKYFLVALGLALSQTQTDTATTGSAEIGSPVDNSSLVNGPSAEGSSEDSQSGQALTDLNVTQFLQACPQLAKECPLDDDELLFECLVMVDLSVLESGPCMHAILQLQNVSSSEWDNVFNSSDYSYNQNDDYEGMPTVILIDDYNDYGYSDSAPAADPLLDVMLMMMGFDQMNLTNNGTNSSNTPRPLLPPRSSSHQGPRDIPNSPPDSSSLEVAVPPQNTQKDHPSPEAVS